MERISSTPRSNWQSKLESQGLSFHSTKNELYWNEYVCYRFQKKEITQLENATREIHAICLELVDSIVSKGLYSKLNIPEYAWPLIEKSWNSNEESLCGRLDFSFDGIQPPKLLEYNADIPACILESSLVQKQWHQDVYPESIQFNSIHERLVTAWSSIISEKIHLTWKRNVPWIISDVLYLGDTAKEAGYSQKPVYIDDVKWNGNEFIDADGEAIKTLIKRVPWEQMPDEFFSQVLKSNIQVLEPAWKMILNNKGFLVLLWELFPGHPNLLPAFFDNTKLPGDYVKKPMIGREGANISMVTEKGVITTGGEYGAGKFMFQKSHCLPDFEGNFAVIGSWIIAGEPAGIIVREDNTPITRDTSRFVPHIYD